jgi:uncharacterized protein
MQNGPEGQHVPSMGKRMSSIHTVTARWLDWSGKSIEHLVLKEASDQIVADAVIVGNADHHLFAARYIIVCDVYWRVRRVKISEVGSERITELASDGVGNWVDRAGTAQPQFREAIDIDISITPFTNTLPIRRLNLQRGQSKEIVVVYIRLPDISITTDRQRYTCLDPGRLYRYESIDTDFTREIEVDAHGLVKDYPELFRRDF